MTYPETIKYLESFINYEKIPAWPYKESLKLERIEDFLAEIGNPQDSLRCLHVAGTKGKGSTCLFITYILREAGFKVGLYTSPHLSDFRERIRILSAERTLRRSLPRAQSRGSGQATSSLDLVRLRSPQVARDKQGHKIINRDFEGMISENELVRLVEKLKPAIERHNRKSTYGPLSFFEAYTALAFVYFKEKKVDFAVLETGLGGRLDATNAAYPCACAITSLSYEHTQKLGNTLREIAQEKAGIIKGHRLTVISAPQEKEAREVIRKKCKDTGAKFYEVGRDITYQKTNGKFKVRGIFGEYRNLKIRLLGEYQLINASVAVGVIEALRFYGIKVSIDSLRRGLYNSVWPGRCEVISRRPYVILDGAQNTASGKAIREAIQNNFNYRRLILVLGISKDKDIPGICRQLCPIADSIIVTQAKNPRAASVHTIGKIIGEQRTENPPALKLRRTGRVRIIKTKSVQEAKAQALGLAKKEDLILVTGSLFLVGEFRNGKV